MPDGRSGSDIFRKTDIVMRSLSGGMSEKSIGNPGRWRLGMGALGIALLLAGCGGNKRTEVGIIQEDVTTAIGVNGYLWSASLDTLSFLPMAQIDSASGIIMSEWYINPDVATERLKVTVSVRGRGLRADALKVTVHRQELRGGAWRSAEVRAGTELQIEDAILTRARQLRIQSVDNDE